MHDDFVQDVSPTHNAPEMSVSELALSLKRTLEETYSYVRVRGELSRVSIPRSGHMYSSLKDDNAVIDAVCWKGVLSRLSVQPEEGLEVIVAGRMSSYPQRSNYQLIIESMELAGEGALLKMLEQRRKKLAAEGLFDESRKQALPFLPQTIGVVTSQTGAVIRDIMHRLRDRFPRHVLVWPVLVQGDGAAEQVVGAIEGFNKLNGSSRVPRPDLLIVARGGGSLEDLMPFNEENVVRAVAASAIPIISAVGHETDTTLCDYAADVRAPTPTGAAEMAVPERLGLLAQVQDDGQRLMRGLNRRMDHDSQRLGHISARIGKPERLFEIRTQRMDHISSKLDHGFDRLVQKRVQRFHQGYASLRAPKERVSTFSQRIDQVSHRLSLIQGAMIEKSHDKLRNISKMLEMLSYQSILSRGYAVVRDQNGSLMSDSTSIVGGQMLDIELRDGRVSALSQSGGISSNKVKVKKVAKNQGDLF